VCVCVCVCMLAHVYVFKGIKNEIVTQNNHIPFSSDSSTFYMEYYCICVTMFGETSSWFRFI
jgi:hypothetical protein